MTSFDQSTKHLKRACNASLILPNSLNVASLILSNFLSVVYFVVPNFQVESSYHANDDLTMSNESSCPNIAHELKKCLNP